MDIDDMTLCIGVLITAAIYFLIASHSVVKAAVGPIVKTLLTTELICTACGAVIKDGCASEYASDRHACCDTIV